MQRSRSGFQINQHLQPFFWLEFLSLSLSLSLHPPAGCRVPWSCIQRVSRSKSAYKCQGLRKWDFLGESSEKKCVSEPKNHLCQVFRHNRSVLFGKKCALPGLNSFIVTHTHPPPFVQILFFCSVLNWIFFENKFLQEELDCVLHLLAEGGLSILLYAFPGSIASLWGYSWSHSLDFGRAITSCSLHVPVWKDLYEELSTWKAEYAGLRERIPLKSFRKEGGSSRHSSAQQWLRWWLYKEGIFLKVPFLFT